MFQDPCADNIRMSGEVIAFLEGNMLENPFDAILGRLRDDGEPYSERINRIGTEFATPMEFDRLEVFHNLMQNLRLLCGSDTSALNWLIDASAFCRTNDVWSSPFEYVERGDFWALVLLADVTSIIISRSRELGTDSVSAIFDFREFSQDIRPDKVFQSAPME